MYGWLTFYHEGQYCLFIWIVKHQITQRNIIFSLFFLNTGHEVAKDFKSFMTDLQVRLQRTRDNYTATQNEAENLMHRMLEQRKNVSWPVYLVCSPPVVCVIWYLLLLLIFCLFLSRTIVHLVSFSLDLLIHPLMFIFFYPLFFLLIFPFLSLLANSTRILVCFHLSCTYTLTHQKPQDAGSLNKMYTRQGYLFLLEKSELIHRPCDNCHHLVFFFKRFLINKLFLLFYFLLM